MTSPRKRGPHGKPPSAGTPAGPTSSQSGGSPRFARSEQPGTRRLDQACCPRQVDCVAQVVVGRYGNRFIVVGTGGRGRTPARQVSEGGVPMRSGGPSSGSRNLAEL